MYGRKPYGVEPYGQPELPPPDPLASGTQTGGLRRFPILQAFPQGLKLPRQQPRGAYNIDWSHPVLGGISFLKIFDKLGQPDFIDNGTVNQFSDGFQLNTGAYSLAASGYGIAGRASTNGATYNVPRTAGTVLEYLTIGSYNTSDSTTRFALSWGSGPQGLSIVSFGSWDMGWNGGSGDFRVSTSMAGTFTQGVGFLLGFSWSAAGTKTYSNGRALNSSGSAPTTSTTAGSNIDVGGGSGSCTVPVTNSDAIHYIAVWNRELSPSEIQALNDDPWMFLIPAEGEMPALFQQAASVPNMPWMQQDQEISIYRTFKVASY